MTIESLSAIEAILIALSGLVIVLIMLGSLSLIIMLTSKVVSTIEKKVIPVAEEVVVIDNKVIDEEDEEDVAYGAEMQLVNVDEKTAVCIMAIISEETGIPLKELIFKKIRRI